MKFASVYSSSINGTSSERWLRFVLGGSLSEPLGLRSLIPSLAWLSVDELRAVVTGCPSAFQALSPPSSTNTFAIPRRRRASATRAPVNSRGEEQYRFRRDPAARKASRVAIANAFQAKNPSLSKEQSLLAANASLQIVRGMMALYEEADSKGKVLVVAEFKKLLTLYLGSVLSEDEASAK